MAQDGGDLRQGRQKGTDGPREGSGLQSPELPRGQEMGRLGGVPKAPAVAQGVQPAGSCQEEEEAGQNAAPSRLLVPPLQKLGQEEQRRGQQRQNQANQQVPSGKPAQRKLVPAWRTKYSQAPGARRADRWQATAAQRQMGVRFMANTSRKDSE